MRYDAPSMKKTGVYPKNQFGLRAMLHLLLRSKLSFYCEGKVWNIRHVPARRKWNLLKAGADHLLRGERVWSQPTGLMIEPTESESKAELDRFIGALINIREEIRKVENGCWPADNNPLKNAPHTQADIIDPQWERPYSREEAVFPLPWVAENKFWPSVNRIDEVYGDRNLKFSL